MLRSGTNISHYLICLLHLMNSFLSSSVPVD